MISQTVKVFVLCIAFLQCEKSAEEIKGTVVKVADGDTFTMLISGKRQMKVRLYGIDAPEKTQPYYNVSKQHLSAMIFQKEVTVDVVEIDRYGRSVGIAKINDANLNEEMLKAGLAWHYVVYDDNPAWIAFQADAKNKKAGLWADRDPIPPWLFRKNKRKKK